MTSSEMTTDPQVDRAYFTEGSRIYREYIFTFYPLMQSRESKENVCFCFHTAASFLSVLH